MNKIKNPPALILFLAYSIREYIFGDARSFGAPSPKTTEFFSAYHWQTGAGHQGGPEAKLDDRHWGAE